MGVRGEEMENEGDEIKVWTVKACRGCCCKRSFGHFDEASRLGERPAHLSWTVLLVLRSGKRRTSKEHLPLLLFGIKIENL